MWVEKSEIRNLDSEVGAFATAPQKLGVRPPPSRMSVLGGGARSGQVAGLRPDPPAPRPGLSWKLVPLCAVLAHLTLQPRVLTSRSCVLSLLSPFFPVLPLSQAVRSLTVRLSRWRSNLVAGGPDFWVRPAWLFVCNTFTPSLSLCFCRLDLFFHAVHVHLSWLNYYYPQKFGSLLIMIKDVEITIGFCERQNKFLEELPLPRPTTEGTGSLSMRSLGSQPCSALPPAVALEATQSILATGTGKSHTLFFSSSSE